MYCALSTFWNKNLVLVLNYFLEENFVLIFFESTWHSEFVNGIQTYPKERVIHNFLSSMLAAQSVNGFLL